MQTEILSTLLVFLNSTNREIVKSTLGFIKLAIHTLPISLVRPHLPQLVPALLSWARDHKNHFKAKVRHIFERMIRRFGWESVYGVAVDLEGDAAEEGKKILLNIKKRKDRAKKKKSSEKNNENEVIISNHTYRILLMTPPRMMPPPNPRRATLSKTSFMGVKASLRQLMMKSLSSQNSLRKELKAGDRRLATSEYE